MEAELDTFQWALPDRSENRGEITLDENTLRLVVWCMDNDPDDPTDPDSEYLKPLDVAMPWDPYMDPRDQIRRIVHGYLTHEADEQMWFGDERPFYPHPSLAEYLDDGVS